MAREHARILCSIWRPDSAFRKRTVAAQQLYFVILSQRELNNAGAIPLMVSKWSRCAEDSTTAHVEKYLAELIEHRYVLVDWDTEELLVRSFMRNDGILKHPYTRRSALRSVEQIESVALRREAAAELIRIGHPEGVEVAMRLDPDGSSTTHRDAIGSTTQTTHPDGFSTTTPTTDGGGEGEGEGGGAPVPEDSGGGENKISPRPANLDPENPRCGAHADIPATERGPNCRACAAVRRQLEADPSLADDERARRRRLIDDCPDCDENGMRDFDGLGLGKCTHPNLTEGARP